MESEIEPGDARAIEGVRDSTTKPIVVVIGRLPAAIVSIIASAARIIEYEGSRSTNDGPSDTIRAGVSSRVRGRETSQSDDAMRHENLQAAGLATCVDILPVLSPAVQPAGQVAILHAADRPNVSMVARWLGQSTRSLQRTFIAEQLPPPSGLIRLARWLAFARTADRIGASPRTLARLAGFTTVASLHKGAIRELGLHVRDLHMPDLLYDHLRDSLVRSYGIGRELGPGSRASGDAPAD